jgi:hypothetical protein
MLWMYISVTPHIADVRCKLLHGIEVGVVTCHANGNARGDPIFSTRSVVVEDLMKHMRGGSA